MTLDNIISMPIPSDPTELIWGRIFAVSIPQYAIYNEAEVEQYGLPSCGIPQIDAESLSNPVPVMLNIDKIAEHFRDGVYITASRDVTTGIFITIHNYLGVWKKVMRAASMNTGRAPAEDLILLDELAEKLYSYSSHNIQATINSKRDHIAGSNATIQELLAPLQTSSNEELLERSPMSTFLTTYGGGGYAWS